MVRFEFLCVFNCLFTPAWLSRSLRIHHLRHLIFNRMAAQSGSVVCYIMRFCDTVFLWSGQLTSLITKCRGSLGSVQWFHCYVCTLFYPRGRLILSAMGDLMYICVMVSLLTGYSGPTFLYLLLLSRFLPSLPLLFFPPPLFLLSLLLLSECGQFISTALQFLSLSEEAAVLLLQVCQQVLDVSALVVEGQGQLLGLPGHLAL
ncbi:hypothetical protein J4Q44_G00311920 [Coregonus suidteri]|uniref:Uncharacterized protein n=1 Tax=Coregonus suidteri TaxID=861788 RepID=A0AAN8KVA7_9TELE